MNFIIFLLPLLLLAAPALAADTRDVPLDANLRMNIPNSAGRDDTAASAAANNTDYSQMRVIERIAAIVNDDIITGNDLSNRMALAFFSSGLPPTQENQAKVGPQVLRGLVDETLERQEAKKQGITVDSAEIDRAVAGLAQQNNMPPEQLTAFLGSRGVKVATLRGQVESSLLWSKVVQRELRPLVEVGDEEINTRMAQIAANAGKPEYLVAEIFLRVDDPADESQVSAFAQGLYQQLQNGAPFPALAQQFSQGAGALQGGDLGWIEAGQLSPELDRALLAMRKGQLSEPIRDSGGYHILLSRDQRLAAGANPAEVKLQLQQISIPASTTGADLTDAQLLATAKAAHDAASSTAPGCADLERDVMAKAPGASVSKLDDTDLSSLPSWLGATVQSLQVGQASDPVAIDGGAAMVVLCGRTQPTTGMPTREQVLSQIGTERLELQARRLMRDLRREATVDVRIGQKSSKSDAMSTNDQ